MSARGIRLLIYTALVAAAVSYIFFLNRDPITVHFGGKPEYTYTGPLAVVLVTVFFLGVFICAMFAFLIGVRYQIKDWRFSRAERQREDHERLLISAREKLASGRYGAAQDLLKKIIDRDPDDIIARIQLAEAYLADEKASTARSVLDQTRSEKDKNIELLFLAAAVDRALGNHTGAMDNLHLVLGKDSRNLKALTQLVADYEVLERYPSAIELQRHLVRYAQTNVEQEMRLEKLAMLELGDLNKQFPPSTPERKEALENLLKRHRDFVPALIALADLERETASLETASRLYAKAFKLQPNVLHLKDLADLWLAIDEPSRAIAQVRNALASKELSKSQQEKGQLFLVTLLIHLESIDEALSEREKLRHASSIETELRILDALLLKRTGGSSEAFDVLLSAVGLQHVHPALSWFLHSEPELQENWIDRVRSERQLSVQPAPRLLTN